MMEKLKAVLKLVRWFHELAIIVPFAALYLVIDHYSKKCNSDCTPSFTDFLLLCFCVQLLVAAGCVLNDIVDRHIDEINKPVTRVVNNTISLKSARMIFWILTLLILILSVYISIYIFREWIYISATVYFLSLLYDHYLKRAPLLGNIVIGLLSAFIPIVLFFFAKDCIRSLHNERINVLICLYSVFPFLIIVPRELSLDISDMEGDRALGCKTLPILVGARKSKRLTALLLLVIVLLSIPTAICYPYLLIPLISVDLLILMYIYKLRTARTRIEYIRVGRFLWFIMFFGLVMFITFTILYL